MMIRYENDSKRMNKKYHAKYPLLSWHLVEINYGLN